MKKGAIAIIAIVAVVAIIVMWGIGVNNRLVTADENVQKAWSQVENVYKRRMDLIPQLVATVQGAADYEKSVLTEVTNARAGVEQTKVDPSQLSEEQIAAYQKAQDNLSKAVANTIKGSGNGTVIKVCTGSASGTPVAYIEVPSGGSMQEITAPVLNLSGKNDLYFVFNNNISMDSWNLG